MSGETLIAIALTAILTWIASLQLAVRSERQARLNEARALAAGLWAEMIVYRDANARLGMPEFYRSIVEAWKQTGELPLPEFLDKALDYPASQAYPLYWASLARIGALGHDLAAKIAQFQTLERVLLGTVRQHIHDRETVGLDHSRNTAKIVGELYEEFLTAQGVVIEELAKYRSEGPLASRGRFQWLQLR